MQENFVFRIIGFPVLCCVSKFHPHYAVLRQNGKDSYEE
jgi:hypothetical protein